jgi:hypothetical protein
MRIIKKMRRQTAVYWEPSEVGEEGQMTFLEPIEIKCRWEDITEQYIDRAGTPQTSSARVYVDRDLFKLGVLWLPPENLNLNEGDALSQVTSEEDPFANSGAFEIRKFEKLPVLKPKTEDDFLRTCWL